MQGQVCKCVSILAANTWSSPLQFWHAILVTTLHEVGQILLKTCLIGQAMQLPHTTPNLFHLFSSASCASCLGREDTNHIGLEDLMAIWVGNAPFSGWQCSGSTCGSPFHSNSRDLLEKTEALIWLLNQFQPHKHPWFQVWLLFNCFALVICLSALVVWIAQSREDKQTSFLAAWHSEQGWLVL